MVGAAILKLVSRKELNIGGFKTCLLFCFVSPCHSMFKFFCLWMKVLCLRLEYSKQNINSPKLWKHWKIQVNYTNELLLCIFHFCDMIQVYPPAENKNKLRLLKFIENNHCCDSPVKRCNIFFWRVVIANLTFWLFPQCIFLYGKRTDRFIVIAWICIRLYCKLLNKCLESKAEKLYLDI